MKKIILTLTLPFSSLLIFAQEDSLLKNFKFRNSNYRAISTNVSGSGQYGSKYLAAGKADGSAAGGSFQVNYYSLKSTDRILFSANTWLGTNFDFNKSTSPYTASNSRSFSFYPSVAISNKWFSDNFFTELGVTGSLGLNGSNDKNETPFSTAKSNYNAENLAVTISVGTGRLENINDMQNALWLNRALEKEERISRSLSEEELSGLGRTITKANNTRVLDFRKRIQFVLETVDEYLQTKGLINNADIRYFSNLNDILFFAINQQRLSGTEKFIRLTPGITDYRLQNDQQPDDTRHTDKIANKSVQLSIGINKHVPVNLYHQNNFGGSIQAFYLNNHSRLKYLQSDTVFVENDLHANWKQGSVAFFFQHAIYPNTRTAITLSIDSKAGYQELEQEKNWFGMASLSGNAVYFISYRTTLNCSIGASYNKNVYDNTRYLLFEPETMQFFANVGLQVAL